MPLEETERLKLSASVRILLSSLHILCSYPFQQLTSFIIQYIDLYQGKIGASVFNVRLSGWPGTHAQNKYQVRVNSCWCIFQPFVDTHGQWKTDTWFRQIQPCATACSMVQIQQTLNDNIKTLCGKSVKYYSILKFSRETFYMYKFLATSVNFCWLLQWFLQPVYTKWIMILSTFCFMSGMFS